MKNRVLCIIQILFFLSLPLCAQDVSKLSTDFKNEKDPAKQYALVKSMAEMNSPALNSLFLDIVEGPYAFNMKRTALQGIEANSQNENMVVADRIVTAMQKDKDELVIEAALNLLAVIGSAKHTPAAMPYLTSPVVTVREAAAKALYGFGTRDCIPGMKDLLSKETGDSIHSKNIRKYAMLTIGRFKDVAAIPELETTLMKSINNRTNQDESLYAVNAIKSADSQKAKDIVSKNTNLILNSEVRENLMIAADLMKAENRTTTIVTNPQPNVKKPLPPPDLAQPDLSKNHPENKYTTVQSNPQPQNQPEKATNIPAPQIPTEVQFDLDSVKKTYPIKEDALKQVVVLSNLCVSLVSKIENGEADTRYYGRVADITFKMAEIMEGLKDKRKAGELYDKANAYYQRLLQKGGH